MTEDCEPGINKKLYIEILQESFPGLCRVGYELIYWDYGGQE